MSSLTYNGTSRRSIQVDGYAAGGKAVRHPLSVRTGPLLSSSASAFVEATVNAVVSKRFAKKQQMQWSRRGAHLLLQTRTKTLDGTLRSTFERWYPGLANDNDQPVVPAQAA